MLRRNYTVWWYPDNEKQVLERVRGDRRIASQVPEEDRRRRTIIVERVKGSFGFTLQTYGIKHKRDGEVELLTYVDFVESDGPAMKAGMRAGDVILSINGRDVQKSDHRSLVKTITSCESTMRLVVLFEDCVRKVDLHMKYLRLKRILQQKVNEYELLCGREKTLLKGRKRVVPSLTFNEFAKNLHSKSKAENGTVKGTKSLEDVISSNDITISCNGSVDNILAETLNSCPISSSDASPLINGSSRNECKLKYTATLPRTRLTRNLTENGEEDGSCCKTNSHRGPSTSQSMDCLEVSRKEQQNTAHGPEDGDLITRL